MISQMQDSSAPAWLPAARRAVREYRDILSVCTHFPRAGERNIKVEEFVDLCVAVWVASGASGEHAGWVIDILWWATRLTFNSHKVFMHMARICAAAGDFPLARRTLRLYWQVVSKARDAGTDADTDVNWVTTLVWGARMLCRLALVVDSAKGLEGVADAREGGVLIEKARTRLDAGDRELSASVDLAEGIWNTVMAIVEQDHFTRSSRLEAAMALLERSIETNPTASVYYHLALAYYRPIPGRDLDRAIQNARCAVEIEPKEVRYWHLLGLLLFASEDWSGAKGVLEVGCAIDEQYWSGQTPEDKGTETPTEPTGNGDRLHPDSAIGRIVADGIATRDFGMTDSSIQAQTEEILSSTSRPPTPLQGGPLLDPSADDVPPAATLLGPLPDHPNPNRPERFEHALQLRMSQLALTELLEGPEGAGEKWVEVFGWFAEKKGLGKDASQRTSMDTSRQSVELKSENGLANGVQPHGAQHEGPADGSDYPQTAVPITFTPATPHEPDQQSFEEKTPRNSHEGGGKEKENPGKKVQKMLKNRVHKGQQRITTIGKKLGHGVGRTHSLNLRRTTSTPAEFYTLLSQHYQASSIHSRRQFSPFGSAQELPRSEAPPSPPPPEVPPREHGERSRKERRLLSDLWLMSAATFRRSGKIEQARGAIQEAELGLYYTALGNRIRAIQAFNKALFISPDNIPATIHLCQQYLSLTSSLTSYEAIEPEPDHVDLAAGMLTDLTKGAGWDVAEAWYFLGKAHGIRGMRDRERECLNFALGLSEGRPLRDIGAAVGWSL
ncbi:hypothetical protein EWM64_g5428 [Hericium alpestre]|uniref:TPR-like protein n=1 Tax=Hericium alpestre TaxID=135208 RepID=A0A4Y9ZWN3_9AGAM|nr:hypothetical protein EWM64_g5428 [Hericium alpestre]